MIVNVLRKFFFLRPESYSIFLFQQTSSLCIFQLVINSPHFTLPTISGFVFPLFEGRDSMGKFLTLVSQLHSLAGPVLMLLYPLYASVVAIESTSKLDDEQWLAYWILYSFLTLMEMLLQPILQWIPIWYSVKLIFVAWLVLPQFKGAAFLYERFVRQQIKKYGAKSSQ